MKKDFSHSIIVVLLLLVITIAGSTYAYFSAVATSNNSIVNANSEKYEIVYHGGTEINGHIRVLGSHENADNTTVEIGLAQGVTASINATLFITVENISPALSTESFKWEVYRIDGTNEIYVNSDSFNGKKTGDKIPIVTDYPLTNTENETLTKFKVYLWIDGNNSDNNIEGGTFEGYIGARTDVLTGIVKTS